MESLSVAYLGPPASYTHQAAKNSFPSTSNTLVSCTTISDVFAAVQSGKADRGVVPFENSTYGPVLTTLDLFATSLKTSSLNTSAPNVRYTTTEVCGEAFVQVRHFLLGYRQRPSKKTTAEPAQSQPQPQSKQNTSTPVDTPPISRPRQSAPHTPAHLPPLTNVKRVLSHEQALGQCKQFLSTSLPHAEKKVISSTSKAAEIAAADETGETAAVCSELAAEVYRLDVLRETIQDRDDNATRFMILRKPKAESSQRESAEDDKHGGSYGSVGTKFKALVLFTVDHTSPGVLADALAVFREHGLNLTSINTRPSGAGPWNYFFFVEVEGRCGQEISLDFSLQDLRHITEDVKCLGSWKVVG